MAIRKSNIRFSAHKYEYNHGIKPRGYGDWGFSCLGINGKDEFWYQGMFTQAKKAAMNFCAENEYRVCRLLP